MEHCILHNDRIVDLREIRADVRVQASIEFIEHLQKSASLQIVAGNSPLSIKQTILDRHGSGFKWTWIKSGPKVWHARIKRAA